MLLDCQMRGTGTAWPLANIDTMLKMQKWRISTYLNSFTQLVPCTVVPCTVDQRGNPEVFSTAMTLGDSVESPVRLMMP